MDSKILFGKIQTNRVSIKKYMEFFKKNKKGEESFISPRPKPGTYQEHYYALLKFPEETKNRTYFQALKSFAELSEEEYKAEMASVKFSWEV